MAASTQGAFTPLVRSWLSIMARRAPEDSLGADWLEDEISVVVIGLP
jgi:hypothetical protein